jgi:hypothetical protein
LHNQSFSHCALNRQSRPVTVIHSARVPTEVKFAGWFSPLDDAGFWVSAGWHESATRNSEPALNQIIRNPRKAAGENP